MANIQTMTDAELAAADAAARAAMETTWTAWKAAIADGKAGPHCPEMHAHSVSQKAHDPIGQEVYRRDHERKLAAIAHLTREPLTGPVWEAAWRTGPGREAA